MKNILSGRLFFIFLKSAVIVAVVLTGLYFKSVDVGYFSSESLKNVPADLKKQLSQVRDNIVNNFPIAEGARLVVYQWEYQGRSYEISQTLYTSIYQFYKSQPKAYSYFDQLPENWEEEYYGMFVTENEKDNSIMEVLDLIIEQGRKNKLSDDEMVELVVAFVQSIPYDEKKAANISARTGNETMDYPYEVLFENSGVCSDKSFLAMMLIRKLDYGAAIFVFENENHMAIGIQCPREYSNYSSGYCFVETTGEGNKIGIIPELKADVGKAVGTEQLDYFQENDSQNSDNLSLTDVKIFQKTQGKQYQGITETIRVNDEIASLKKKLAVARIAIRELKVEISEKESTLTDKKKELDEYLKENNIDKYNKQAQKYNGMLLDYENLIKTYNKEVGAFNDNVSQYNQLIKL